MLSWLRKKKSPEFLGLNELTNPEKWDDAEWMSLHRELGSYAIDTHCFSETKEFAYRKGWEWTQCLYGLHQLGMIRPEATGLGIGAGREPILFYLADRIQKVVGTDLYGNASWTNVEEGGNEADAGILSDVDRYCRRSFRKSNLELRNMDGTKLEFPSEHVDFVWSLSSIEHFGGHEAAAESVREMARVTKSGGIVAIATEFILTPDCLDHQEYFTKPMFEKYVLNASTDLKLVCPMDYSPPSLTYLLDPIMVHLGGDVHRCRHHIILNDSLVQWTSVMSFFRKI